MSMKRESRRPVYISSRKTKNNKRGTSEKSRRIEIIGYVPSPHHLLIDMIIIRYEIALSCLCLPEYSEAAAA